MLPAWSSGWFGIFAITAERLVSQAGEPRRPMKNPDFPLPGLRKMDPRRDLEEPAELLSYHPERSGLQEWLLRLLWRRVMMYSHFATKRTIKSEPRHTKSTRRGSPAFGFTTSCEIGEDRTAEIRSANEGILGEGIGDIERKSLWSLSDLHHDGHCGLSLYINFS